MHRRLVVAGSLVIAFGFLFWFRSHRSSKPSETVTANSPGSPPATSTPLLSFPARSTNYTVPGGGPYQGLADSRWNWWNTIKKTDRAFEWKMRINFYGRAIDQNEQPVPAVKVRFQWTDMSPKGISEKHTETDANGLFSLTGQNGKRLGVWLTKDGYHSEAEVGGRSFEYAAFFEGNYHTPDPTNPVVFRLVKKFDAEPLIARRVSRDLAYNSAGYYYDLEHGTLASQPPVGSNLKFTFERSESLQGEPFDWKLKVDGVNSALIKTVDEFAQLAPDRGYEGSWQTKQTANMQDFQRSLQARFYVRTNDNRYARVEIAVIHPNARTIGPNLTVLSYLNPSGSRNLEYDPNQRINK